jgi:hypothetical protein
VRERVKMGLRYEKEQMKALPRFDRRRHPRYLVEIPLDYTGFDTDAMSTGLTANASEGGVMVFVGERLDVWTVLNVTFFFRLDFSLTSMEAKATVIWRDDVWKEYLDNYRYGLRFLEAEPKELDKLRRLLEHSERQETLYIPVRPKDNLLKPPF